MEYTLGTRSHTGNALQYHFVTVTKYRADLLTDEIAERFGEIASVSSAAFGVNIQTFQADIDASANIARRVDPRGESVPLDTAERDDSPRDGSGCPTATTPSETVSPFGSHEGRTASIERHREMSEPAQMTLRASEASEPAASDD